MLNKKTKTLPVIILFTILTASFSTVVSAESLDKKLQKCKQEFSISHNKDSTQEVATAAKLKHLKLMKEILHELNVKNGYAGKCNGDVTPARNAGN